MVVELFILGSVAFCEACGIYDATLTEKGIKAGVGVESNTWLVGEKPSSLALYLRDNLTLALVAAPSVIAAAANNPGFAIGACAGQIVYGIKHIIGGRSWSKLLNASKTK